MTLPASGQLSFSQIQAEFARGYSMSNYTGTPYFSAGGGGVFPSSNLSFSNFYSTSSSPPPPSFVMSYLRYAGQSVAYVSWSLTAPGYPFTYWQLYGTYASSGLPLGLVDSGYTDAGGNADRNYTVSDAYWFPPPKTNCFDIYLSGYGWVGTYCLYGY